MESLKGDPVMEKKELLYEGKAKKVYATDDSQFVIVEYKDDATAFNGQKKGTIAGKGVVNNRVSNFLMSMLMDNGVPTHYVQELSDRETLVKKAEIIPLEVIIRNISAGSFCKRYGVEEGIHFKKPIIEFSYKNDDLGDPLITESHIEALNLSDSNELNRIKRMSQQINYILKEYFATINVELVDFKLEFGRIVEGFIILADEISPDTCRLWDATTHEKLDKDRFRQNLGGEVEAYNEIMYRIFGEKC